MAGRRLTLNDLLNDDPSPPQRPPSSQHAPGADCFPLSLQASSARRTPSPPRGRYDPLSDARMSTSAGSSGGHSRSPGVPYRYLTGPGYSPSMSLPRPSTSQQQLPQHSPSPLGGLEALVEAASAEQRRMQHDESARRSSAVSEYAVPHRKRKRPSDPTPAPLPPPPRVLAGPGMQAANELSEKEREVIALMAAARAASRSPEHNRSPLVHSVPRSSGPRRPWEDAPSSSSPAAWRPPEPIAQAAQPTIRTAEPLVHAPAATIPLEPRHVELQPAEPVVLRRVQLTMDVPMDVDTVTKRSSSPALPTPPTVSTSPSSRYTFKSPVLSPSKLPASKPPSANSKPSSTASKPPSSTSKPPSKPPSASKPPSVTKPSSIVPEVTPTTFQPPATLKPPSAPKTSPVVPKVSPTTPQPPLDTSKPPSVPKSSPTSSKPPSAPSKPPSTTSKAASPPRSPSPPPSRDESRSPELPSFAGPSWGARPSLAKLAPTKARPSKPVKRERAPAAPAASTSPVSATSALPASTSATSPVLKSPVLPEPTPAPAPTRKADTVERMLEESAGLATPSTTPVPAPREKEKETAKKGKAKENPVPSPAPPPAAPTPEPVSAPAPVPAPAPPSPPTFIQYVPKPAPEPKPSVSKPAPPVPALIHTSPTPVPPASASPIAASPALDADEELARSLDAQLNRRARPERERRRTEKLRDAAQQPDLETLLAQAERERAAAPSKNRARDKKRAEDAARKKQEEEAAKKGGDKAGKEDGERGREKRRRVDDDDELDAELLSLVGDSRSPARARESMTATASPPPPTKAELERESMPPPPSPDEERASSALAPRKRGRPPGAKNRPKGIANTSVGPAKKPAQRRSTPGARSRSSSVMPMPSSSLAHEVKFDTDDEPEPDRAVSMEVDRAPEPEDAIERAWAQREERERAKKEEKEREKALREQRRKDKDREKVAERQKEGNKDKSDAEEEDDKLYCVCKMPYDEEKVMIACDRCDEWYHTSCVDMPDSEVDLVDQFICPPCIEKEPHLHLRTTYKRRCQRGLEDDGACNRPSRGALSKYCSDACGVAAVRSRIGAWNGDRAALWESVRGAERREGVVVRVLDGSPLPNPPPDTHAPLPHANGYRIQTTNGDGVVVLPSKPRASRTLARLRAQLDGVVAQRGALTRALEGASWRQRLLQLASARADADSTACGWDQRLCFGDAEIAEFGGGVFESYEKDAARRAERGQSEGTDGEREEKEEDDGEEKEKVVKMDVDGEEEEAQWWCDGRKKCDRHAGWQKLRQVEVEFDTEMKTTALDRLTTRERDIRRRVEDILDPHAPVPPTQVDEEMGTPEPMVNGHAHGGAARVNGVDAAAKKSKKKA